MKKDIGTIGAIVVALAIAVGVASAGSYDATETYAAPVSSELSRSIEDYSFKPIRTDGPGSGTCGSGKPPRCYRERCGDSDDFTHQVCPAKDQCNGKEYCTFLTDTNGRTVCAMQIVCSDNAGGSGGIVIQ